MGAGSVFGTGNANFPRNYTVLRSITSQGVCQHSVENFASRFTVIFRNFVGNLLAVACYHLGEACFIPTTRNATFRLRDLAIPLSKTVFNIRSARSGT
jgi:hypothetical protein